MTRLKSYKEAPTFSSKINIAKSFWADNSILLSTTILKPVVSMTKFTLAKLTCSGFSNFGKDPDWLRKRSWPKRFELPGRQFQSCGERWQQSFSTCRKPYNGKRRIQLIFETPEATDCFSSKFQQKETCVSRADAKHCLKIWLNDSSWFTKWLTWWIIRTERTVGMRYSLNKSKGS